MKWKVFSKNKLKKYLPKHLTTISKNDKLVLSKTKGNKNDFIKLKNFFK